MGQTGVPGPYRQQNMNRKDDDQHAGMSNPKKMQITILSTITLKTQRNRI